MARQLSFSFPDELQEAVLEALSDEKKKTIKNELAKALVDFAKHKEEQENE